MQYTRGVDTDEIEQSCAHKVEHNGGQCDPPINPHSLILCEEAQGFHTSVALLIQGDVDDITVRPAESSQD